MLTKRKERNFPFSRNDVVLARYDHELFYAKIISISYKRRLAKLLFDDESREDVPFRDIFDVNETTSDIICVICKKDSTDANNDIVLCDECNIGYHQQCHEPIISSDVLKPEIPWECIYCLEKTQNPHVESNPFQETEQDEDEDIEMDNLESSETQVCQERLQHLQVDDNKTISTSSSINHKAHEDVQDIDMDNKEEKQKTSKPIVPKDKEVIQNQGTHGYGDEVVIAHADSTSPDDDNETLIIDIESDDGLISNTLSKTEELNLKENSRQKPISSRLQIENVGDNTALVYGDKIESQNPISMYDKIKGHSNSSLLMNPTIDRNVDSNYSKMYEEVNDSRKKVAAINQEITRRMHVEGQNTFNEEANESSKTKEKKLRPHNMKVSKTLGQTKVNDDRYFKDLPKHNWLIEKLKMEKKLDHCEINKMEKTIYTQINSGSKSGEDDFLKRYLEEKHSSQKMLSIPKVHVEEMTPSPSNRTFSKITTQEDKVVKCETDGNNNDQTRVSYTTVSSVIREQLAASRTLDGYSKLSSSKNSSQEIVSMVDNEVAINTLHSKYGNTSERSHRQRPKSINLTPSISNERNYIHNFKSLETNQHSNINRPQVFFRQISDVTDVRPFPMLHSPVSPCSLKTEHSICQGDDGHHQPVNEDNREPLPCKTRIFKPEEIDKCLRNIPPESPAHHKNMNSFFTLPFSKPKSASTSPVRLRDTRHAYVKVEQTNAPVHRYQPYTSSTITRRSRISSDSNIQYLSPSDIHSPPIQTKRPSSAPRQTTEHYKTTHSPIRRTPSTPGFSNFYKHHQHPFNDVTKQTYSKDVKSNGHTSHHLCANCGRSAKMLCSGCRKARYCSRECQLDDWQDHLHICRIGKLI